MKKRGISPLIAVVLLVAIAVVLATIVLFFVRGLSEEQTEKSEDKLFLGQVCLEDVNVEYNPLCFVDEPGDNETINLSITNRAEIPIEEFTFKVIGDEVRIKNSQDQLGAYETKTYNLTYRGPIYPGQNGAANETRFIEILIKKKINYQNVEGYCADDELNINVIFECP